MSLLIPFDHKEPVSVSMVGGKGSNLIALSAAGFPVPPGFVITTHAQDTFFNGLDWLDSEIAAFDYDRPDKLRQQSLTLRERLASIPLPDTIRVDIREALSQLDPPGNTAFAVRSSSTLEDLAQAAFAGQHDTYLNVRGLDAICARVRDCFVSLWGDRAILYRHHQGCRQRDARMAVAVQRQIRCDVAGVAFSMHPVSGRIDRLVIDANYGLGESVVAGECEVDHFELDKTTLQVSGQTIGHKDRIVVATDSGIEERHVPAADADCPCMSESQIRQVADLVKRAEAHYGWPQDIEWGMENGTLYQFQSRPVTTFPPRWTRDESAERFPNPMTPLTWDFISVAFRSSLTHSMSLMGLPPMQGDWFARFENYIYGNQNAVELIASYRPLRSRSVAELAAEIPELRRRYSWVLDLPVNWARDLDRYLIRLGRLSAIRLDDADVPELWRYMNDVLVVAADYFRPNIAISMTQAFLHRTLHALVKLAVGPERALAVVDGLLAGCETKTAVVNRELHELAQLASRFPGLKQELIENSSRDMRDVDRLAVFPEFAQRFTRFIEDHGHREMDMDYFHPTWADQPSIVLDAIALILRGGSGEDPAETARRQRAQYFVTEHQFLAALPEQIRFFFRELIRLARTYTALDDLEHYQTTRVNPVARRAALVLGQRLQERQILERPEDVFFFHKTDLEELVAAYPDEPREDFRRRAANGRRSYEESALQAPRWHLEECDATTGTEAGEALKGIPGSSGTVTGTCFVVRVPDDFARFPKGAILVARTTNPAWTPLFYSASGLITETGGPLSHGAVTAREMQLPAVMSVRNVMSVLSDGQRVTVDGSRGVVRID